MHGRVRRVIDSRLHRPEVEHRRHDDGWWRSRAVCPTCGPLTEWLARARRAQEEVERHCHDLWSRIPDGFHCVWEVFHNRRWWEACQECERERRTGRLSV